MHLKYFIINICYNILNLTAANKKICFNTITALISLHDRIKMRYA